MATRMEIHFYYDDGIDCMSYELAHHQKYGYIETIAHIPDKSNINENISYDIHVVL